MKNLSASAALVAIALACLCAPAAAEDKTNATAASKSTGSVISTTKPAKAAAQAPTQLTHTKALSERGGTKQSTPGARQAAPTAERPYESCHGKDADA